MNMVAVDVPLACNIDKHNDEEFASLFKTFSLLPLHCNSHQLAARIIVGYAVYGTCVDLIPMSLSPSLHWSWP